MKVGVAGGEVGFVKGGRFVPAKAIASVSGKPERLFEEWDDLRQAAGRLADVSAYASIGAVRFERPVPFVRQAFGVGLNYLDHSAETEMALPTAPMVFMKAPTSVVGPEEAVVLGSDTVDWEAELVVVIGRDCRAVDAADADSVIAGFTIGQDLSDRTTQFEAGVNAQFGIGKSAPGFGPIGPWIVTADELSTGLDIECWISGVQKQKSNTESLIFSVPKLIEFLSSRVQLLAGDVIFTGTPAGVGATRSPQEFLRPGDEIVTTIAGIGTLSTKLVAG